MMEQMRVAVTGSATGGTPPCSSTMGAVRRREGRAQVAGMSCTSVLEYAEGGGGFRVDAVCAEERVSFGQGRGAGSANGWVRDWSGLASETELEDVEASSLGHWILTGQLFQSPGMFGEGGRVDVVEALGPDEVRALEAVIRNALAVAAKGHQEEDGGGHAPDSSRRRRRRRSSSSASSPAPPSAQRGLERWPKGRCRMGGVRVRIGQVEGRILVDVSAGGLPLGLATQVSGGTEVWSFLGWRPRQGESESESEGEGAGAGSGSGSGAGAWPGWTCMWAPGGTPEVYGWDAEEKTVGACLDGSGDGGAGVAAAEAVSRCEGRWAGGDASAEVECWRGEGGHVLVRPTVGGRDVGLFVLDTGTACCVLSPGAVEALGGERFAAHQVLGQGGSLATSLVRGAGDLQWGGLTLVRPLFREMVLEGAVRGPVNWRGPGPVPKVVGVLGYDVFAHCSVTVAAGKRAPGGGGKAASLSVRVGPPGAEEFKSDRVAVGFQSLRFLSRVPHLEAACVGERDGTPRVPGDGREPDEEDVEDAARLLAQQEVGPRESGSREEVRDVGLYKVALGVGGVAVVLGARTAEGLGLGAGGRGGGSSLEARGMVSAPGSKGAPLARLGNLEDNDGVRTTRLNRLETRGASFDNVRALWHVGGDPDDLELSTYAAGVLGADLFRDGCSLTLDYARRRCSLAQQRGQQSRA